jgi:hypothetical protein
MSGSVTPEEGAACRPNISASGMRVRRRIGVWSAVFSVVFAAALVVFHARWFWRLAVFFPTALAAVNFLQVSRKTCVSRAAEGTFEHEDFSRTPAAEEDARRSRVVARGINRDSILVGVAATALALLSTRLR